MRLVALLIAVSTLAGCSCFHSAPPEPAPVYAPPPPPPAPPLPERRGG